MQFKALGKNIKRSPSKLRPIADVIRGKSVQYALNWLTVYPARKALPIKKVVQSAAANAKNLQDIEVDKLTISEIKVDQGPAYKYFRPGPMGRSKILRKRLSHITVVVKAVDSNS